MSNCNEHGPTNGTSIINPNANKHAYLIIAFNHWDLLEKLLHLLDDKRNDIYIHINKAIKDFDFDYFSNVCKKSDLFFLNRLDTSWGTNGLALVTMSFYEKAGSKGYSYYHVLSGMCLPLKNQNDIHEFFTKNAGKEFIHYTLPAPIPQRIYERYSLYHFFAKYIRSDNRFIQILLGGILEPLSLKIQKLAGVDRQKKLRDQLCYGSNWYSITHNLVCYINTHKDEAEKLLHYTFAPDECWLQTMVYNSSFAESLFDKSMQDSYMASLRAIDWARGNPYVWRKEDYSYLMNSDFLFARKFNPDIDSQIIEMIYNKLIIESRE